MELDEGDEDVLVGFGGVRVVGYVCGIDGVGEIVVCVGEGLEESGC